MPQLAAQPIGLSKALGRLCLTNAQPRTSRSISSTVARSQLPPASPNYVDFPRPELPEISRPKPVKGIIPVPRDVFRYRRQSKDKLDKSSEEFAARATMEPATERDPTKRTTDFRLYKDNLAAIRRENLRAGLAELSHRRAKTERFLAAQRKAEADISRAAKERPIAEDELYTATSVDPNIIAYMNGGAQAPQSNEASLHKKKARYRRNENLKSSARRSDLQSLYLQARTFITTEEQLTKALDEAFDQRPEDHYNPINNLWSTERTRRDGDRALHEKAFRRVKRLGEELTGGRI